MIPTSTQLNTQAATLVAFFAGILAGKGVFGLDATTWAGVLGAFVYLGTIIWNWYTTRQTAIVTQALTSSKPEIVTAVADMAEVKSIQLERGAAGDALSRDTPENVHVGR